MLKLCESSTPLSSCSSSTWGDRLPTRLQRDCFDANVTTSTQRLNSLDKRAAVSSVVPSVVYYLDLFSLLVRSAIRLAIRGAVGGGGVLLLVAWWSCRLLG